MFILIWISITIVVIIGLNIADNICRALINIAVSLDKISKKFL